MPTVTETINAALTLFNDLNLLPLVAAAGVVGVTVRLVYRVMQAVRGEPLYGPDGYHYNLQTDYLERAGADYEWQRDPGFHPTDDPGYEAYLQYAGLHGMAEAETLDYDHWIAAVTAGELPQGRSDPWPDLPFVDDAPADWLDSDSMSEDEFAEFVRANLYSDPATWMPEAEPLDAEMAYFRAHMYDDAEAWMSGPPDWYDKEFYEAFLNESETARDEPGD